MVFIHLMDTVNSSIESHIDTTVLKCRENWWINDRQNAIKQLNIPIVFLVRISLETM